MFDFFYPVLVTAVIGIVLFVSGLLVGSGILASRFAPIMKAHPIATRWFFFFLAALLWFLFIKFLLPLYRGFIGGVSATIFLWGTLSRIEKHFLRKEFFRLSFWIPESLTGVAAKDGM